MASFWKNLIGSYLPTRWKVTNNTNYGGKKGILFTQEFVWEDDAKKEFSLTVNYLNTRVDSG